MRRIIAKYAGACAECGQRIQEGDPIGWDRDEGSVCEHCLEAILSDFADREE